MQGTHAWPPTGLISWFSKIEGNTYATLLHHPFLFKGKPTQCSRGSKKDFWRRCRGGLRKVKSRFGLPTTSHFWRRWRGDSRQVKSRRTKYPSQTLIPHITLFAICLSFSSPPLHLALSSSSFRSIWCSHVPSFCLHLRLLKLYGSSSPC